MYGKMWVSDTKTIVVLGATGFIGKWLCKEACSRGYHIIAVGRSGEAPEEFKNINRLRYVSCIYDMESIRGVIMGADAVINLAATRSSSSFSINDYMENIELAANCIEACRIQELDKIVFLSSCAVYSQNDKGREDNLANPISLYGESKLAVDNLCSFYNNKYNMNIVSLRCAQVLGWGERTGYVLNTFLDKAKRKETLELWGKGVSIRRYIYVKDVVDALLYALEAENSGVFNIGMQESVSLAGLAEIINRVFENVGNIKYTPYEKEDTTIDNMCVEKAEKVLGWKPKYDLLSALEDMKSDYEKEIIK